MLPKRDASRLLARGHAGAWLSHGPRRSANAPAAPLPDGRSWGGPRGGAHWETGARGSAPRAAHSALPCRGLQPGTSASAPRAAGSASQVARVRLPGGAVKGGGPDSGGRLSPCSRGGEWSGPAGFRAGEMKRGGRPRAPAGTAGSARQLAGWIPTWAVVPGQDLGLRTPGENFRAASELVSLVWFSCKGAGSRASQHFV